MSSAAWTATFLVVYTAVMLPVVFNRQIIRWAERRLTRGRVKNAGRSGEQTVALRYRTGSNLVTFEIEFASAYEAAVWQTETMEALRTGNARLVFSTGKLLSESTHPAFPEWKP